MQHLVELIVRTLSPALTVATDVEEWVGPQPVPPYVTSSAVGSGLALSSVTCAFTLSGTAANANTITKPTKYRIITSTLGAARR